ncbi:MAG: hypothetical protein M3024_04315 [Candidatus Dormibacteraeota bacterium]|nr:hypothetical protein [Candidatus Dormibacteraeota bacterium]
MLGGDLARYGALNAVTRAAQDAEDYDRATELEALGGVVLAMDHADWRPVAVAARESGDLGCSGQSDLPSRCAGREPS